MTIAVYSGNIPSTTFIENLIDGLSASGFEILLFGKLNKKIKERKNVKLIPTPVKNIPLIFFIAKHSFILLFKDPNLFFKALSLSMRRTNNLKSFLKRTGMLLPILNNQPDIFHIQWAKTVEQNSELFTLLKSKIAVSLRGAHINYSPLNDPELAGAYKKYFPQVAGFHAVSDAIGKEAEKYGADPEKIRTIYTSVKYELLKEEISENNSAQLQIISAGRFHWKKGYHYALEAMKSLKDDGVKFHYTIIAQGEIPEEIIFLMNEYDLKDSVSILGGMDHEALISKLRSSDIFLLPSVEEGIANVVLEAMAVGIPVITTDCGGMTEAVNDNVSGYIVNCREPEQIAGKIKEFLKTDKVKKDSIISEARKIIKERFDGKRQVKEFTDFYDSLAKQKNRE